MAKKTVPQDPIEEIIEEIEEIEPEPITRPKKIYVRPKSPEIDLSPITDKLDALNSNLEKILKPEPTPEPTPEPKPEPTPEPKKYKLFEEFEI